MYSTILQKTVHFARPRSQSGPHMLHTALSSAPSQDVLQTLLLLLLLLFVRDLHTSLIEHSAHDAAHETLFHAKTHLRAEKAYQTRQ